MDEDLLFMSEVAAMTRKTTDTLRWYRLNNVGPPSFKLGRRVVYRRSAVEEWIRAQEHDERTA